MRHTLKSALLFPWRYQARRPSPFGMCNRRAYLLTQVGVRTFLPSRGLLTTQAGSGPAIVQLTRLHYYKLSIPF